jgi:hypothetical protein
MTHTLRQRQQAITRALGACLVPTDEFTPENWEGLDDPFPVRGEAQTALEPA